MKGKEKQDIIDKMIISLKNYNEAYVENSWENFQEKRKKKKRKMFIVYFSSGIAASLLLGYFAVTILSTYMKFDSEISSISERHKKTQIDNKIEKSVHTYSYSENNLIIETTKLPNKNDTEETKNIDTSNISLPVQKSPDKSNLSDYHNKNEKHINTDQISFVSSKDTIYKVNSDSLVIQKPEMKTDMKKLSFGFVVSESTNSTSSSSNISCAFGITNDIKLNSKLAINTGIILGKYNLNYSSKPGTYGPVDEPISTGVELICIDIPLNLKYNLLQMKKSSVFIISGVSTLGFINERYHQQYLTKEIVTTLHLRNIDFSGQFNLSCGWQYHVLNRMHISIETYAKLPLYKLAEKNITFYQTGVSLKISN